VLRLSFGYKFMSESGGFTGKVNADIIDVLETQYFT
jgi:hypothetical protein